MFFLKFFEHVCFTQSDHNNQVSTCWGDSTCILLAEQEYVLPEVAVRLLWTMSGNSPACAVSHAGRDPSPNVSLVLTIAIKRFIRVYSAVSNCSHSWRTSVSGWHMRPGCFSVTYLTSNVSKLMSVSLVPGIPFWTHSLCGVHHTGTALQSCALPKGHPALASWSATKINLDDIWSKSLFYKPATQIHLDITGCFTVVGGFACEQFFSAQFPVFVAIGPYARGCTVFSSVNYWLNTGGEWLVQLFSFPSCIA
jgi:hypothetical protein